MKWVGRVWIVWVWSMVILWAMAKGEEEYVKYKDPKQAVGARVQDLLGRMTLEEKIGQMVQIDRIAATSDIMKDYMIGSLLSGGGSAPLPQATAADWVNMVNDFQKGSLSTRLGIPMIYGIDAVHGHNNVYNATIFPHNIGLGATRDPELLRRIGDATAVEVRATGIPYTFAPCIAVCRDPRWGRCYESYSEDPKVVEEMTDIILGLQGEIPNGSRKGVPYVAGKNKVAACAKHFVGDGGTTKGVNEYNTVTDMHGLLSIHMPAYYDSIIKGVSTIMVSYSSWNGNKMHANHDLITGFLKGTLKFKGFVISDWQGIDRITTPAHSNYTYSVLASVQAGIDMIMVPYNHTEFINDLTYLVKNNFITMDRIDDAVARILLIKFNLGLFENPLADLSLVNEVGSQAHRDLAREAVRKSLVLLKNGKNANESLLPLPKKASKILVAGSHADNLGYQCGGWTIGWQGFSGNNGTRGTTILGAINSTVDKDTEVIYLENPDSEYVKSNHFNYAIVAVGEHPYTETAGDSETLAIANPGPDIIKNVCGAVECVVIIISGRPIVIEPYLSAIDALVAAWLPGSEGQGVADALFGDYGFTGKLSRTWFKTVDQLPMNVGDSHYDPLFPFGFGLTTKSMVARSVSAGVDRRPYGAIAMIFLFVGLYFQEIMAELDQTYEPEQAHEQEYQPEQAHEQEYQPEHEVVRENENEVELVHENENEKENEPEDVILESSHPDEKQDHADEPVAEGGEKWPGWPGESVFRMLVPAQKVGSIIGRKGEYIKKTCEETKARIKILDGPPGTRERAVMVSAKEEPDAPLPPAVDGLLRVLRRVVDGLENDSSDPPSGSGEKVSTRLLVPAAQAGSLIGKQGTTVKSIQEESNCIVRVLGSEDLPVFALQDDRVVEVVGEPAGTHKAIELIASHLRKFLVDRSIISIIEMQMQMPNSQMDHMPPSQHWGPPPPQSFPQHAHPGPGYGASPHFMPPRQFDNYYPHADMPPPTEKQHHQGISAYGREAPVPMHSSSSQAAPSVITQVTQQMQIPLSYADAVIGTQGANISYIRRVSGATVTIQEARGLPGEMTVEISGTASQVQTAQQLIQNFMAEAAGASQSQHGASTEQVYNSYGGHGSLYASNPSNPSHAGQSGSYGPVYGNSYGY